MVYENMEVTLEGREQKQKHFIQMCQLSKNKQIGAVAEIYMVKV